jgi:hypothetical protein
MIRPEKWWRFVDATERDGAGSDDGLGVGDICYVESPAAIFTATVVGATSSTWVEAGGSAPKIRQHSLTSGPSTPQGLWQLQSDFTDDTTNANTLTRETGSTDVFAPLSAEVNGYVFDGTNNLFRSTHETELNITGDCTTACIVMWMRDKPGIGLNSDKYFMTHSGDVTDEAEAANFVYSMRTRAATDGLRTLTESGGGTNAEHTVGGEIPANVPFHIVMRRLSDVTQYFVQGAPFGLPSPTLATPTGGTTGLFRLGGFSTGNRPTMVMASAIVWNVGLTDPEVFTLFREVMG